MEHVNLGDQQKEEALQLLTEIIEINTVNPPGNERQLVCFIAEYLKDAADEVYLQDISQGRSNVAAVIKGKGNGKSLVLNGHLDTVPYGDQKAWKYPPGAATIDGSRIYGRGASDMKSGLAALLYAYKLFSCYNNKSEGDIIFLGTSDEESSGSGALKALQEGLLENTGAILIGEPTNNSIALASKGAIWLELEVYGKSSHGAYPQEGINAVEITYELISFIKKYIMGFSHKYLLEPTCTLTGIRGGIKTNMVPDYCKATVDIRTVPAMNHKYVFSYIDNMIEKLEEKYPGLKIVANILNDRMAVETDEQDPIVKQLAAAVREVTGKAPQYIGTGYFSDASVFLKEKSISTVLFGPGLSKNAHKADEYVEIEDYFAAIQCYLTLLMSC